LLCVFVVVLFCETLELKINKELFGAQKYNITYKINYFIQHWRCRIVQHCTTIPTPTYATTHTSIKND